MVYVDTATLLDAFESSSHCPLCYLLKRTEEKSVALYLGEAVMVPEERVRVNEAGFCTPHWLALRTGNNKLGVSLQLTTHLEKTQEILNEYEMTISQLANQKSKFFSKSINAKVSSLASELFKKRESCLICEKILNESIRYSEGIVTFWKKEESFRKIHQSAKGYCLKHLPLLFAASTKYLDEKTIAIFSKDLLKNEISKIEIAKENLTKFSESFHYNASSEYDPKISNALSEALELL